MWEYTGRRGTKGPAHTAWVKVGRPGLDAIRPRWDAYLLSERPARGFVKDLSSWLNQGGHTQDWPPFVDRGNGARPHHPMDRTAINMAAAREFLAREDDT